MDTVVFPEMLQIIICPRDTEKKNKNFIPDYAILITSDRASTINFLHRNESKKSKISTLRN